ncbi:MAG: 50S ribosomal protein L24 [Candidatus Margulisiibacteriota bacterium]|nr:50S ribosomal protein L24 [Candidatus Margulisiibacteriota bacterium]
MKAKIKKDDQVLVTSGRSKGKKAKVVSVDLEAGKVLLEGVNTVKRHMRPTQKFQGGIVEKPAPINISNLMVVCPKCSQPTRVGRKTVEDKNLRYCKKCQEIIDKVK